MYSLLSQRPNSPKFDYKFPEKLAVPDFWGGGCSPPSPPGSYAYEIKHLFSCASSHLIYCISCSRCGMLYIGKTGRTLRTRFGEHRRAVQANDVHQPVARHFNAGNHCISDMKIRALCPVSGSNDSRKKQEMSLISKLGTLQPLGINERFSYL